MTTSKDKIELIKQWGAILTVVVSLVTGVTAHMKEEKIAVAVYKELSEEVKKNSETQVALQVDMANIKGQLDGQKTVQVKMAEYQKEKEDVTVQEDKPKEMVKPKFARAYASGAGLGAGARAPKPQTTPEPTEAAKILATAKAVETVEITATPQAYEPPAIEELVK